MLKLGGVGWPGVARRGGDMAKLRWCGGKGMDLTFGACVSTREEREGESGERCNPEGMASRARGLPGSAIEVVACGEWRACAGRTRPAGLDPRERFKWN
jgi:hypothetical protein